MVGIKVEKFKLRKTINYTSQRAYYTNTSYKKKNVENIHNSFSSVLNDKSRELLSRLIVHINKENKLKIPLFLTPLGIKASHDLINMINLLPEDKKSKFSPSRA